MADKSNWPHWDEIRKLDISSKVVSYNDSRNEYTIDTGLETQYCSPESILAGTCLPTESSAVLGDFPAGLASTEQNMSTSELEASKLVIKVKLSTIPGLWAMDSKNDAWYYFWIQNGQSTATYTPEAAERLWREKSTNDLYGFAGRIPYATDDPYKFFENVPFDLASLYELAHPNYVGLPGKANPMHSWEFSEQMLDVSTMDMANLIISAQDYLAETSEDPKSQHEQGVYDLSQALVYLDALEKGEDVPFKPSFDPNQITKDAMYINTGYQLYYDGEGPESNNTQAQVNEELLKYTAQVLLDTSLYADGEQPTEEALIEMFKASLPENFTSQDVALFTNTMMNDILEKQYAGELDYEGQLPGQIGLYSLEELSGVYLSALRVDEIRVELQTWDYKGQIANLSALETSLSTRIPDEVLGISTTGVKTAIVSYFSQYRDFLDQHNAELEAWREKMPFIEQYYAQQRLSKEGISDNMQTMTLLMGGVLGLVFEPIDWMVSLSQSLETRDPIPFLISIIPLIPGVAAKIASKADELMDMARGAWRVAGELTDEMIEKGAKYTDEFFEAAERGLGTEALQPAYAGAYDNGIKALDELSDADDLVLKMTGLPPGTEARAEDLAWELDKFGNRTVEKVHEGRTAVRLEDQLGITLRRPKGSDEFVNIRPFKDPDTGEIIRGFQRQYGDVDFINTVLPNQSYDFMTAVDHEGFSIAEFKASLVDHANKQGMDFLVIDVTEFLDAGRISDVKEIYKYFDENITLRFAGVIWIPPR